MTLTIITWTYQVCRKYVYRNFGLKTPGGYGDL